MRKVAGFFAGSVLIQLILGAVAAALWPPVIAVQSWPLIGPLAIFGLFLGTGLEMDLRSRSLRRSAPWRIFLWSSVAAFLPAFATALAFGFETKVALLIATVLLTTGTGVTVRTLMRFGFIATPTGQILALLSALEDLPALIGLLALLSFWGAGGDTGAAVSGLALIFVGLLAGLLLRALGLRGPGRPLKAVLLILLPVYFFALGTKMRAEALVQPAVIVLTLALTTVSLAGKGLPAWWIARRGNLEFPRILGWGLVPRGVPGLVFAAAARQAGLVDDSLLTVLLSVVALTTWLGLAGLERELARWRAGLSVGADRPLAPVPGRG